MFDPFLAAHRLSSGVYALSGRVPISIRDQLVRAHYLVDRLFSTAQLGVGDKLVVVGGGASGVTAAILAARRGAKVQLLEATKSPFHLQRVCTTRWIDPVQYDWPASHAEVGQWPIDGLDPARIPLGFDAGTAAQIAARWTTTLTKERLSKSGNLEAHFGATLKKTPKRISGGAGIEVLYKTAKGEFAETCKVVVLAKGIAAENTFVEFAEPDGTPKKFEGPKFWAVDNFERRDFGLTAPLNHILVVSGGGDGALQDFIRLVTGQKSPIHLLSTFRGVSSPGSVPGDIRRKIYEAEQEARCALLWNSTKEQDHPILFKLHNVYIRAIDEWVSEAARWKNVTKTLSLLLAGREIGKIRLYHPCLHFSQCYPLNHLLALALNRYIYDSSGEYAIVPNHSLTAVRPPNQAGQLTHTCSSGCWNQSHVVEINHSITCLSPNVGPSSIRRVVDGVIIRHGLRQHTRAQLRRTILPTEIL